MTAQDAAGLTATDLSVTFVGTRALADASLRVPPGQFHALLGGNGSGKSTMIKLLAGVQPGDGRGLVRLDGHEVVDGAVTPEWASTAGLSFVHQDLGLFPGLTVAENLFAGVKLPSRNGLVSWKRMFSEAEELLRAHHLDLAPGTLVSALRPSQQTQVAIARAMRGRQDFHGGVLALDEPTARLTGRDALSLMDYLKTLQTQGQTILLVTHRLDEVMDFADRATVMRDGRDVADIEIAHVTKDDIVQLIARRDVNDIYPGRATRSPGDPVLRIKDLRTGPVASADLNVRAGEIVGIGGLAGSGRSSILETVYGLHQRFAGSIEVLERPVARSNDPRVLIRRGVGYVPEDRARQGAFAGESVTRNITPAHLGTFCRRGLLDRRVEERRSTQVVDEVSLKTANVRSPMRTLSGGNQQKAVLGRWLSESTRLLLLDEPTQGVDVGARMDIYRIINQLRDSGTAILVVSSDDEELLGICDRVAVLRGGRLGPLMETAKLSTAAFSRQLHGSQESA